MGGASSTETPAHLHVQSCHDVHTTAAMIAQELNVAR